MIKVWCESCNGHGVNYIADYDYEENHCSDIEYKCDECNGKGYAEHEGTVEDLEFGLALKLGCEKGIQIATLHRRSILTKETITDLMGWYESQKSCSSNEYF